MKNSTKRCKAVLIAIIMVVAMLFSACGNKNAVNTDTDNVEELKEQIESLMAENEELRQKLSQEGETEIASSGTEQATAETGSAEQEETEGQEAEAKACGFESGRKTDKSKRVQTHLMAPGLPVLDGAAAAMVCRVRQVVKYEDHTVFFAEIEVAEETEAKPLPYVSGDYFPAG